MRRNAGRGAYSGPTAPISEHLGCSGKRCYPSWSEADKVAKRMNRHVDDAAMEPYKCKHCNKHHIGNADSKHKGLKRHV